MMTRTPDEIKKGLEYISIKDVARKLDAWEDGIPYDCVEDAAADALALIQQLQDDNAEKDKRMQQLERSLSFARDLADGLKATTVKQEQELYVSEERNRQLEAQNAELIEALTQLQQKDSLIKRLDQELVDAEQLAKRIYDKLVKAEERLEQFEGACEKWIKVEDQLPKVLTNVLVAVKDSLGIYEITIAFQGSGKWVLRDQEVRGTITHWMALPEPPKEE